MMPPAEKPQSICRCGHNGDGPNSAHEGFNGHGPCRMAGCHCLKFTWAFFTVYGQERAEQHRKERDHGDR